MVSCLKIPCVFEILKWLCIAFFGTRGIGTNGASPRVFKKNCYFDDITENKGF